VKAKGDWDILSITVDKGVIKEQKLQKINRYYISKEGVKLIKRHKSDGREIQIESGSWLQKVYNKQDDRTFDDAGINEEYYLEQIYKEIHNIDKEVTRKYTQLELF
jgi:hypothetical protein